MIFIQPSIDPIFFSLFFIDVRWYSLAYIIAFVFGSILIKKNNSISYNSISNKQIDSFFLWAVIGVICGGRSGYVFFYQIDLFFDNPIYLFEIWKGGMSFHGGLTGIILSSFLFSKKNNLNFLYLSDLIALVAPIGLFFGRLSNFINSELYGRVTEFQLAVIYPSVDNNPRHPSQIYEALLEGFILFFILNTYFYRNPKKYKIGNLSAFFLIYYGFFRLLVEFLREPDSQIGLILNYFSMGQILSIPLIIFGLVIYFKK
tara:strand:- start:948 stop:1724 length:777 start_codon:yes stop_codon:yes gene_type:complete